jgi:[ribosomal protein S5]-alanine N-acetyltransferase
MLRTSRLLFIHPSPELLEQRLLHEDSTTEVLGVGLVRVPPEFAADILFLLPSWAEQLRALTKEPRVPGGVLILQAEALAVGTIGFKNAPTKNKEVEIGYGINASHWGLGLASEAVQALTTWAFETNYATRVTAKTAVNNPASMRVLEKNGFIKIGTDYDPDDGDLIVWALENNYSARAN